MKRSEHSGVFLRSIASVFFLYHALAIALPLFPSGTAFGSSLRRPFSLYLELTGAWASWNMFHTIPHHSRINMEIEALDSFGRKLSVGPILPGLTPHDHRLRTNLFLLRITGSGLNKGYLRRYVVRLCRAVKQQYDFDAVNVSMRYRADTIRSLDRIRRDERIETVKRYVRGPFACHS